MMRMVCFFIVIPYYWWCEWYVSQSSHYTDDVDDLSYIVIPFYCWCEWYLFVTLLSHYTDIRKPVIWSCSSIWWAWNVILIWTKSNTIILCWTFVDLWHWALCLYQLIIKVAYHRTFPSFHTWRGKPLTLCMHRCKYGPYDTFWVGMFGI